MKIEISYDELLIIHTRMENKGFNAGYRQGVSDERAANGSAALARQEVQLKLDAFKQVFEQLRFNNKINAIKLIREHTGCGLKEAKDLLETMVPPGYHIQMVEVSPPPVAEILKDKLG